MKLPISVVLFVVVVVGITGWAKVVRSNPDNLLEFRGEITDSDCAHNAPHQPFIDRTKSRVTEKRRCTIQCVERGERIVLLDATRRRVYKLNDEEKAFPFAGQKVRITGTLHNNEISIATIENIN